MSFKIHEQVPQRADSAGRISRQHLFVEGRRIDEVEAADGDEGDQGQAETVHARVKPACRLVEAAALDRDLLEGVNDADDAGLVAHQDFLAGTLEVLVRRTGHPGRTDIDSALRRCTCLPGHVVADKGAALLACNRWMQKWNSS